VIGRADLRWWGKQAYGEVIKHGVLPWVKLPSDIGPRCRGARRISAMVPMRDGVRLATDVYLPVGPLDDGAPAAPARDCAAGAAADSAAVVSAADQAAAAGAAAITSGADGPAGGGPDRWPALVVRQPYGKRESFCCFQVFGRYWAQRGYAFVVQDVRGRWASEGEYDPFVNELSDGDDTLAWVAGQPWCDGTLGALGESYFGYTTWAMAAGGRPELKAVAVGDTTVDMYASAFRDNALCLNPVGVWALWINHKRFCNYYRVDPYHLPLRDLDDACGLSSRQWQLLLDHFPKDEYWEAIDLSDRLQSIDIPVLHWVGWYDQFLSQTIAHWRVMAARRDDQHLAIGATDHLLSPERTGRIGATPVVNMGHWHDRCCRFFDRHLRGAETDFPAAPVSYFTLGPDEWRTAPQWPPADVRTVSLFLGADGELAEAPPPRPSSQWYLYDPDEPVDIWVGTEGWAPAQYMKDRAGLAGRADVLAFDTPPLAADLEVTGPLTVTLFAATSADDTDFIATLDDLHPDGYAHLVQQGIVRARYRHKGRDEPVEPDEVYEYTIDLWATSYVFKQGHRLRLEVSSSEFDRFDRNLNVYQPWAAGQRRQVARQTVWHDAERPSRLHLPVRSELRFAVQAAPPPGTV